MPEIDFWYVLAAVVKSAIVIVVLASVFAVMTVIERRILAFLQGRLGPNRIGPFGLLQPLADGLKMAFKEQIVPAQAYKFVYLIAPLISVIVALSAFAVIPIGNSWGGTGHPSIWDPLIGDINVGLLWVLAISSLAVYGIVLGGWASGNRYSLLGALRSAAQIISYETSLGLALSGAIMWAGTLSMVGIIHEQLAQGYWFIVVQPLGFVIYLIAAFAEVNRAPFDLPEAEQELTAGYLTEYSGLRWSVYQMAEYINMITVSSVAATVFLGGWSFFGITDNIPGLSILVYVIKVALFLFLFIWVRATLPRIRYDHLMSFGWQVLLPLSVLNIVFTACCVALHWGWGWNTIFDLAVIGGVLILIQQRGQRMGIRFESRRGSSLQLPNSVRLAKFEPVEVPGAEPEAAQEQSGEAVKV